MKRRWVYSTLLLFALSACGQTQAPAEEMKAEQASRIVQSHAPESPSAAPVAVAERQALRRATEVVAQQAAEQVIRAYFLALESKNVDDVWSLLSPQARERTSQADMEMEAAAIQSVAVMAFQPEQATAERIVYRVKLQVTPSVEQGSAWNNGVNVRWVTLDNVTDTWQITEISATRHVGTVAEEVEIAPVTWQRVELPEYGLSFEVPGDWKRIGDELAWTSERTDGHRIGFNTSVVSPGWHPTAMLPKFATIEHGADSNLGWAKATMYTIRLSHSTTHSEGDRAIERHVIIRHDNARAYDFYVSVHTSDELATLQPVLLRMLGSVMLEGNQ